jgi:hypothetical protein
MSLLDGFMVAPILAEDQRIDQILHLFPPVSLGGLRRIRWRAQPNRCGVGVWLGHLASAGCAWASDGLHPEASCTL